jgi:hypothetical protein
VKRLASIVAVVFAICPCCRAEVDVTFPLRGYYRIGKYMPVRVETDIAGDTPLVLRAEGAVTVSIDGSPAGIHTVVPLLAAETLRDVTWQVGGPGGGEGRVTQTLTPLDPGQVLVGVIGADVAEGVAAAAPLFPGKTVVPVPLAYPAPFLGPPFNDLAAWEALDAVVFGEPQASTLTGRLFEHGIAVVVARRDPGDRFAWQRGPKGWSVSVATVGPSAAVNPDAYDPVAAWRAGWPPGLRRQAVLLAGVFCILALAATLARPRGLSAALLVVLCAAAAFVFLQWGARRPTVCRAGGSVVVGSPSAVQDDRWTYVRPLRDGRVSEDWPATPVFASPHHLRASDMVLHCGASGRPVRFTWRGGAGTTMAFLSRRFAPPPRPGGAAQPAPVSPLRELLPAGYLGPGVVLEGYAVDSSAADASDWTETWPAVILRRDAP